MQRNQATASVQFVRGRSLLPDVRDLAGVIGFAVNSVPVAWGRDQPMKFYSIEEFAKEIEKSMAERIDDEA